MIRFILNLFRPRAEPPLYVKIMALNIINATNKGR